MSKLCIAFIADSDQYREDEYQDIVRTIKEYNDETNTGIFIQWKEYCGNVSLNELSDVDVLVVFTSDHMAKCLDEESTQTVEIKSKKNFVERFQIHGGKLQRYLSQNENFRKVFVVESEGSEKVRFLADVPASRTFDCSDMDMEEFIGKITGFAL